MPVQVTLRIHRFEPDEASLSASALGAGSLAASTHSATLTASHDDTSTLAESEPNTSFSRHHSASPFQRSSQQSSPQAAQQSSQLFSQRPSQRTSSSPFQRTGKRTNAMASSPFASLGMHRMTTERHQITGRTYLQDYVLHVPSPTATVLDCLLLIQRTIDPTLAFRYACAHGMCGSDAACVNNTPMLLCETPINRVAMPAIASTPYATERIHDAANATSLTNLDITDLGITDSSITDPNIADLPLTDLGIIDIAPLAGFSVMRDIVVDIEPMMRQIQRVRPYLQREGESPLLQSALVKEYVQLPAQAKLIELLSNCIACGICEGSCPVYAGGEAFIGPAALIAAARFIHDTRDTQASERLQALDEPDGIHACQSIRACSKPCPRGIDVGEAIWKLVDALQSSRM